MKILRFFFTLIHLGILLLLLGTMLNAYIPPKVFPWVNLLSLLFPVLMILNFTFIIIWLFVKVKRALLFLAFSLLLVAPTMRWINYSTGETPASNLKVVSFNIKSGSIYDGHKVYDYLEKSGADVILSQEYGREFNIPGYEHRTKDFHIVALNSKAKIIHQEKIDTRENGEAFFADIQLEGKTIRFINVYLNPFSFEKSMIKPSEDYDNNKTKLLYILRTLIPTFKKHQTEVDQIQKTVDASPYPVILAGDLNSVPNSYEYYTLTKSLKDPFVEVGRGNATSFHDYKFPIRIDYILYSKGLTPVSYHVDRRVKMSDHYPVIAEFKIDE